MGFLKKSKRVGVLLHENSRISITKESPPPPSSSSSYFRRASSNKRPAAAANYYYYNSECPQLTLKPSKQKYEIAIVACGSFWNPQHRFQEMYGVKRVIVGYTGGQYLSPTFNDIGDHTYAIFIEYNPKKVTYTQLLHMWHDNDYPWEPEELFSHRSALFVTNRKQQQHAQHFLHDLAQTRPHSNLYVAIELPAMLLPSTTSSTSTSTSTFTLDFSFYQAEEKYQDYTRKQNWAAKKQLILWANGSTPSPLMTIPE